jgi:predicted hydrocarbon binding protein
MSTVTLNASELRPELKDFSSIICFKAIVVGIEEALGEKAAAIALIAAGRARGRQVATQLNLSGSHSSLADLLSPFNKALGKEGTRLCIIDKIQEEGDSIKVFCRETVCSAGEPQGSSRNLTFTLGAIQGALEQITNRRLRGKQVESVLRGSTHDVLEFTGLS